MTEPLARYFLYSSLTLNAKLTCNFCCERLCKMELRDIHKRAQQKLSGGAPCYARRHKPVTHTLGDR
jgi:hypothetical protein